MFRLIQILDNKVILVAKLKTMLIFMNKTIKMKYWNSLKKLRITVES